MTAPPFLNAEQLNGVYAKLERADETIIHLDTEIRAFLKQHPEGGFSNDNHKAADEFVELHLRRPVPPRFSVIAGEIVHHLRSALDHIAWVLSTDQYRRTRGTAIAFPVFTRRPGSIGIPKIDHEESARYERQVKGITAPEALRLIERWQPYNTVEPKNHPLAIINEMDRIDKHHNLVLVERRFDMKLSIPKVFFRSIVISAHETDSATFADEFAETMKIQISTHLAFESFGQKKNQEVVPSLQQLADAVRGVVRDFVTS